MIRCVKQVVSFIRIVIALSSLPICFGRLPLMIEHPTRAHRTRFHLISRLNFRSTHPRTDNCFPMNTRTLSCASSTKSVEVSCMYSYKCFRQVSQFIASLLYSSLIQYNFHSRVVQFLKKARDVGEPEKEIDFTRDVIRLSRPFSKLISRPSNDTPDRRALTLICRHPSASLIHYAPSFPSITWVTERMNFVKRNILFIRCIHKLFKFSSERSE